MEWTWLAGLALGAAVPFVLLASRPLSFLAVLLRSGLRKAPPPSGAVVAIVHHPGILLWLLGLVYATALAVDQIRPTWVVPAALLCLLLAMIAVSVAFFLSIRGTRARLWTMFLVVVAILLNGIQTYDPCYRGLGAYYPPDPLREFVGLSSPFGSDNRAQPIKLVDFQAKEEDKASRRSGRAQSDRDARRLEGWPSAASRAG